MSELSEETQERIRLTMRKMEESLEKQRLISCCGLLPQPMTTFKTTTVEELHDKMIEMQKTLGITNKMIKCEMPLFEPPKLVREVSEGIYPVYYKPIKTISVINLEGVV